MMWRHHQDLSISSGAIFLKNEEFDTLRLMKHSLNCCLLVAAMQLGFSASSGLRCGSGSSGLRCGPGRVLGFCWAAMRSKSLMNLDR